MDIRELVSVRLIGNKFELFVRVPGNYCSPLRFAKIKNMKQVEKTGSKIIKKKVLMIGVL